MVIEKVLGRFDWKWFTNTRNKDDDDMRERMVCQSGTPVPNTEGKHTDFGERFN